MEVSTVFKLPVSVDAEGAGVPILFVEAAADVLVAVVAVVWSLGFRAAGGAEAAVAAAGAAFGGLAGISSARRLS